MNTSTNLNCKSCADCINCIRCTACVNCVECIACKGCSNLYRAIGQAGVVGTAPIPTAHTKLSRFSKRLKPNRRQTTRKRFRKKIFAK